LIVDVFFIQSVHVFILEMLNNLFDLFCRNKRSLDSYREFCRRIDVEHISSSEQGFGSLSSQYCSTIYFCHNSECYSGWHIGLDKSGDDIDGWSLCRDDKMDSYGTSLLCNTGDTDFYVFSVPSHHHISQFIDYKYDTIHFFANNFRIIFCDIFYSRFFEK
jgi:hypothetical protein